MKLIVSPTVLATLSGDMNLSNNVTSRSQERLQLLLVDKGQRLAVVYSDARQSIPAHRYLSTIFNSPNGTLPLNTRTNLCVNVPRLLKTTSAHGLEKRFQVCLALALSFL